MGGIGLLLEKYLFSRVNVRIIHVVLFLEEDTVITVMAEGEQHR